ncbi:MAG: 6-bladed beta-propeller [Prevotellaceae bacterium]|nr:6-bladed beta-propeller [Prevotellaceae bacterium]
MTLRRLFLLLIAYIMIFSCNAPKTVPIINLSNISQSISLDLTDMLKDISMVQINSDFLLSTDDEIFVTTEYLIIYTNKQSIHLFDRDGNHIRKLTERGNGPGEFYALRDFFVDENERILYYRDENNYTRLIRIDISNGKVFDPLQIDFNFMTMDYINGKVFNLPMFRYAGRSFRAGAFPDSAIVARSVSLPSGEVEKYHGYHSYSYLFAGSTIISYSDEIFLLNYDYSDTLFSLKDNRLRPLYVLRLSDKITNVDVGGNGCEIVSICDKGIVLSKNKLEPFPSRGVVYTSGRDFVFLDRKGNVFNIDSIHMMGTQVDLMDNDNPWRLSSLLPVTCGKYGYMMVEHDFFETLPADFDIDNDNPIIIVGTLK